MVRREIRSEFQFELGPGRPSEVIGGKGRQRCVQPVAPLCDVEHRFDLVGVLAFAPHAGAVCPVVEGTASCVADTVEHLVLPVGIVGVEPIGEQVLETVR